ncbi:MAG: hypothetical protein COV69_04355 [Parcubacteria group bacterium CG11_big_fil_rev_8_21_14_0_20_39_14]|nr:MAG: hypothetical protein COV69_04355 [Parcubacteria group bacterium CG11_big_fil_rev_8_21_14_0_20_39_14]PIS35710.1 MAG: hypothetical protein COT36_01005 [Parcubacteria group bacterium CG08_land_8_20_14_0_20_38_56]
MSEAKKKRAGEKDLIQLLEEEIQEIVDEVFSTGEIKRVRVIKAEVNLEVEIVPAKGQLDKNKVSEIFAKRLKIRLAVPVKLKLRLV